MIDSVLACIDFLFPVTPPHPNFRHGVGIQPERWFIMKNGRNNHKTHRRVRYYLYWLCFAWMVAQMALILWKFFGFPPPIIIPPSFPVYYFVVLVVYSVVRASARWAHKVLPRKKGGTFVYLWGIFALLIHIIAAFGNGRFEIPRVTFDNLLFVSIVYVASRIEKRLFLNIRNGSKH
mgnify:CR=1 FL=1|jgi:hypothetical protein